MNKQIGNTEETHKKAILRTYVTLILAFVCMICLNLFAYYTIMQSGAVYSKIQNATINIKLTITNANLKFREIISGYIKKDMNLVWNLIKRSQKYAEDLGDTPEQKAIVKQIEHFRKTILDCYTYQGTGELRTKIPEIQKEINKVKAKNKSLTPAEEAAIINKYLKKTYEKSFSSLLSTLDALEDKIDAIIAKKMTIFKALYLILMINIFILFAFIIYTINQYIKTSRNIEIQLRDTKDTLNTILNSLTPVVITVTPKGNISQWNEAAEKYFGIRESKAINQSLWEIVPYMKQFAAVIERVFHSKKQEKINKAHVAISQNDDRYINISFSPLTQIIQGVVICFDDITALEKLDEQIIQSQKMEVVENLVNGLAHDFNNVIGAITGTISTIKFSLEKENTESALEDLKNNLDVIESSAERATVMVQQLLSLSTKHEAKFIPLDLNACVKHVIKICKNTFDKRIQLSIELFDVRVPIKADPAQLEQALLNICDNAAQAMTAMKKKKGEQVGGELTIALDRIFPDNAFKEKHPTANEPSYWLITISDTGVGIPQDVIDKIFDPFFSTKQGTGMGLAMVSDIIKKHNGFIDVTSELGKGTTFYIYLPEYVIETETAEKEAPVKIVEEEQIPTGEGIVFVVDDEPIMRKTAKSILSKLGYEVIFAEDGEQAVEIFKQRHNEILITLLDMAMPKKSGKEAYMEMKQIKPDLKVLLVSGFKKDKRIDEVLALGVNGFIQKPYSMVTLAQEIKKTVSSSPDSAPIVAAHTSFEDQVITEEPEEPTLEDVEAGFETVVIKTRRTKL